MKNIPSKKELHTNKVHLEWLNIHGEWVLYDTFYDLYKAINYGKNRYLSTRTAHRLINEKNQIIELFDFSFLKFKNNCEAEVKLIHYSPLIEGFKVNVCKKTSRVSKAEK